YPKTTESHFANVCYSCSTTIRSASVCLRTRAGMCLRTHPLRVCSMDFSPVLSAFLPISLSAMQPGIEILRLTTKRITNGNDRSSACSAPVNVQSNDRASAEKRHCCAELG